MRKITILSVVLFLQSLAGFGQISFRALDGYIITLNHDTIYGKISACPITGLSTVIKFKPDKSDDFKEYTTKDLLGFFTEPDKEFTVISAKDSVGGKEIDTKYFALIAVKGEIDLMVLYLDNGKKRFFLNNDELGMSELHQIVKIHKSQKRTDNKYKREISKYFHNNPDFRKRIDKTKFHYTSISKIVNDYNLSFEKPGYIVKKDKIKWHLHVNAGASQYLNNKFKKNGAKGLSFEIKNSFYNEIKNSKFEYVLGLKYRFYTQSKDRLYYVDESGNVLTNLPVFDIDTLDNMEKYHVENLQYRKKTDIIEFPIYLEYNNKAKFLSPIGQFGYKPYFYKYEREIEKDGVYKSDWKFTHSFIIGLGIAINYRKISFRYLIQADPVISNSFELNYFIN